MASIPTPHQLVQEKEQDQMRQTARLLAEAIIEHLETAGDAQPGQSASSQHKQSRFPRQGRAKDDPERAAGSLV